MNTAKSGSGAKRRISLFLVMPVVAVFLFTLVGGLADAAGGDGSGVYEAAKKKLAALEASENQLSRRDCWLSVIESFSVVYLEYPDYERADDALYMEGVLYERLYKRSFVRADLTHAVDSFERLVRDYPKSTLADDALFETAEIYRASLSDPKTAYCHYRAVINGYPSGDMKKKADDRIRELSKYSGTDCSAISGNVTISGEPEKTEGETKGKVILSGIRTFTSKGHTRIVLDVSAPAGYLHGRIKDAAKKENQSDIYIDIKAAALKKGALTTLVVADGQVKKIIVKNSVVPLRVVLTPEGPVTYKIFNLKNPDRVVMDVYTDEGKGETAYENTSKIRNETKTEKVTPRSIKVVVIDPGHGGYDPGAVGPSGYYEKSANVKIAEYLKELLKKQLGLTVIMTHSTDVFLDLKKRTAAANNAGADLFISVHNNASKNRSAYGISTYYLAITSDRKALDVAARENDTTIEKLNELDYILTDLMVSAKRNESSLLAKFVQEGMVNEIRKGYDNVNDVGVCQGPFWVLVGAQMPSILVECSYISNPREEKRLKSDEYLKGLAWGIYKGVEKYIREVDGAR